MTDVVASALVFTIGEVIPISFAVNHWNGSFTTALVAAGGVEGALKAGSECNGATPACCQGTTSSRDVALAHVQQMILTVNSAKNSEPYVCHNLSL